jgi:hypothetical protein
VARRQVVQEADETRRIGVRNATDRQGHGEDAAILRQAATSRPIPMMCGTPVLR